MRYPKGALPDNTLSAPTRDSIGDESSAALHILVVEDNDYNVDVCKEILEFLGQ